MVHLGRILSHQPLFGRLYEWQSLPILPQQLIFSNFSPAKTGGNASLFTPVEKYIIKFQRGRKKRKMGPYLFFCSSCKIMYFANSVHPRIATALYCMSITALLFQCS